MKMSLTKSLRSCSRRIGGAARAVAAAVALALAGTVQAETCVWSGITWTYTVSGSNAEITDASPVSAYLVIPSTLNGKTVTSIGANAFSGDPNLQRVDILAAVTSIGNSAFEECQSLKTVLLPSTLKSIGDYAFYGCSALITSSEESGSTYFELPDGLTSIGDGAFSGCTTLRNVVLPSSLTSLGVEAFSGCSSLRYVSLPFVSAAFVDAISDNYVFAGCPDSQLLAFREKVDDVEWSFRVVDGAAKVYNDGETAIPSGTTGAITVPSTLGGKPVTGIGASAFEDCTSLTDVTIPEGVTSIGASAFEGCTSLTSVTIPDGVTTIEDFTFLSCAALENVTIPEGVTSIGASAFEECTSLAKVSVPKSVTSIDEYAFCDCTSLGALLLYDGLEEIGERAFSGCTSLQSVVIPGSVADVGEDAFEDCTSLKGVVVRPGVESLGAGAFSGCTSLKNIELPDGLESIGYMAFADCKALPRVIVPSSVTEIWEYAFENCRSLKEVRLPPSLTSIKDYTFNGCESLAEFTVPGGVEEIGSNAFAGCTSLTSLTVPGGVKEIGYRAFADCTGLASVTIEYGVETIGGCAFGDCAKLEAVTIPKTVENVDQDSFENAPLKTVYVSRGDTARVKKLFEDSYYDVSGITFVELEYETWTDADGVNWTYRIVDGEAEIYNDGKPAIPYKTVEGDITVPSTLGGCPVTRIGSRAFYKCQYLTSVTIPPGVTSIGDRAFLQCRGMADVRGFVIVRDVLHYYAFSVADVKIPDNVVEIGQSAFRGHDSLASVRIPTAVTQIGTNAFEGTALATVYVAKGDTARVKGLLEVSGLDVSGITFVEDGTPVTPDPVTPDPVTPDPVNPDVPCYVSLDAGAIVEPYSAPKVVKLHGAAYSGCDVVGVVELKLGKVNAKKQTSKVSGSFIGLDGKKCTIKAMTVTGVDGTAPVTVSLEVKKVGMMTVTIGGEKFAGSLGTWHVQSADVGGNWTKSGATVSVGIDGLSAFAGTVLADLLPNDVPVAAAGGKWKFAKAAGVKWAKPKKGAALPAIYDAESGKGLLVDESKGSNLSAMKLTYTPKKGTFKGSFKVYALEGAGKATKLKKYTFKVSGVVADGVGYGQATCKKPAVTWAVLVK